MNISSIIANKFIKEDGDREKKNSCSIIYVAAARKTDFATKLQNTFDHQKRYRR